MTIVGVLKPPSTVMTPELKIACEIVFQEHKTSPDPVNWNKDAFRGRISIGLREMAKETLLRKNVIYFPNPAKKINTMLNPAAAAAATFEEAIEWVQNKVPSIVTGMVDDQPAYFAVHIPSSINRPAKHTHRLVKINGEPETKIAGIKWYMKPLFYYIVWPVCAAALSILIAYLISCINF